jgi:hypothetical protein
LFEDHDTSSEELDADPVSESEFNDQEDIDEEDDDTPLYRVRQSLKTGKKSTATLRPKPPAAAAAETSRLSSPAADNVEVEEQDVPDYANYEPEMATEEQLP